MRNDSIIYGLIDPRTDEYKYVGKSVNGIDRAKLHLNHSHNPLVNQWVCDLKSINMLPIIGVLENVTNWEQLIDKEKYWIGKLIGEDYDLFNIISTDSFNDVQNIYSEKLKKQINERENRLRELLNKSLYQFGGSDDISDLIKLRRKSLNINQTVLSDISGVGLRTLKAIEANSNKKHHN